MAQRGLSIVIGGQVAGSLLSGLAALRDQLKKLSSEANQAGKSQVASRLGSMADKVQSATDKVQDSAELTGEAIREMFSEVSSAANSFSDEMNRAGKEGAEGLEELANVDFDTQNQVEAVRSITEAIGNLSDEDLKKGSKFAEEFEKTMKGLGLSFTKAEEETDRFGDSIQAIRDLWEQWTHGLSDPEGIRSAEKAIKELADSVYGAERALRSSGQYTEEWADSLDADDLRKAIEKGFIEPTRRGFKIHSEKASEYINLTKEQIDTVNKHTNALSELDKELRDVSNWDKQTKAQKSYANALERLTETRGEDTKEIKHWLSTLRDSELALSRYKARFDETETEMRDTIDSVDRLSLVQSALNDDIKVSKKGIQVLTKEGLEPFRDMTVETADKLGLLSNKLKKDLEGKTSIEFEAFKPESIEDVQWLASSVEEVSKETSIYRKRLAELREEESKGIEDAKEMREAWEKLASQYEDNNKAADQVWKNLNKIENTIHSQVSALDEQDKAYEKVIRNMDRVAAYQKIFGKSDDLKIMNKRFQALNEAGLTPFNDLTEEAAENAGLLHTRYKKNIEDVDEYIGVVDEWSDAIKSVAGNNQAHAEALDKMGEKYGKNVDAIHRYNSVVLQAYKNVNRYIDVNKTYINQIEEEIEKRREAGKETSELAKKLEVYKENVDKAKRSQSLASESLDVWNERMGFARRRTSRFAKDTDRLVDSVGLLGGAFMHVGRRFKQFAAFAMAALAVQQITQAIHEFIQIVSDYDQALHNLQAILEVTSAKAQVLGDNIQQVAEQTKFSATETAQGVQTLGQAGLTVNESINALQGVTDLATGTMSEFASVSDLVTTTLNAFHLEAVETTRVADIFANAINNSKANIDKLTTSFNYVGAAGKQAGLNLNEVTGILMTLYDNGLRASTAGTGLRRMLLKMINPTDEVKENIEAIGLSLDMLNPKMVGVEQAFANLVPLLWDAEKGTVDMQKASEMFGTRAAQVAAVVVESVAEGNKALTEAIHTTKELGSASEMAATQLEGLGLKIKNLQDRLKNIGIALGDAGFTGFLKDIIDALRIASKAVYDFVKSNEELVREIGWASLVTFLTTSLYGLYQVFQKLMITGKLAKSFAALQATISKIFVPTAIASGLVIALDRIVSKTDEAIDHAQKLGAEYDVLSGKAETWANSLDKAFGTMSWQATIQNFKKAFEDIGEDHQNLVRMVEQGNERLGIEGIGFKIEDAINVDQADAIIEKINEIREASWVESMRNNAEALVRVNNKVKELSSVGIDLEEELHGIASDANVLTKALYSVSEVNDSLIPGLDYLKRTIMDVFGKDTDAILREYKDSIDAIREGFEKKPDFDEWGIDELQERIDDLFDSVDKLSKDSFIGREIISEVVFSKFSEFQAKIDAVRLSLQKQQNELSENEELTKEQESTLNSLKEETAEFERIQKKASKALVDAIVNGTKFTTVNEILKAALPTDEFKLYVDRTSEISTEQIKAINTTFNLAKELRELDVAFAQAYKSMSAMGKMNFADEIKTIKDDMKDFRVFLINELGKTEEEADKLIKDQMRKRAKEYLESLKEENDDTEDVYSQWLTQISNARKKALIEVEEGSIEALEIQKKYAKKELDVAQKRYEDDPSPKNYGKLLDRKKEYAASNLAIEEKLTDDIISEIDERIEKVNERIEEIQRDQGKATVEIESKVIGGDLTEAQAEVQMAKNNLQVQERILQERKDAVDVIREEYNNEEKLSEAIAAKEEAEISAKEASNEYKQAKLDQIEAIASRERSLADLQREASLAGIEEEKERFKIIESNRAGVQGYLERESELAYETARAKLDAERMYRERKLDSYETQLKALEDFYGESTAKELAAYKRVELEKVAYSRRSNNELKRLEKEAADAKIEAHGSFWEKTKLGLRDFSDMYKEDTKTWAENTADAAKVAKDSWNDAFSDFIMGSQSASDAFKSFAKSVLEEMSNMLAQSVTRSFLGMFANMLGGSMFGGGPAQSPTMGADVSPFAMAGPTAHSGGVIGEDSLPTKTVSSAVFDGAKRMHDGIKSLAKDEYPAILQKGETVFTEGQLNALGKSINVNQGGNEPPNVAVNVINKTGKDADAEQKGPKFDGEKWVLDVVLNAANKNKNNFGKNLKGTLKKS